MKLLIDTEWFAALKDIPKKKRQEVIEAILDYPNKDPDAFIWQNVIKPTLERGKIKYLNSLKNLKQYTPQKTKEKITEPDTDSDTDSGIYNIKDINKYYRDNRDIGVIGGKEKEGERPPALEEVLEYAREMDAMAGVGGFKCSQETAEQFWAHYESINWRIGNESRTPITNWKAKLRQWASKDKIAPPGRIESEKEKQKRINHEKLQKMLQGELP